MALKTIDVETFSHSTIAGEPIDNADFPFDKDFFRHRIPAVVEHAPGELNGQLMSTGINHGRSYELIFTDENTFNTPFTDQYGNAYTVLNSKGNNFSTPDIIASQTAPSGYIPYGLQEGDAILRTLRASNLMRQAGIDTEWTIRVEEPKCIDFKGEAVSPAEYKRRIYQGILAKLAIAGTTGTEPPEDMPVRTFEEAQELYKAIKDMDFFVTLRAMSTPIRINDLYSHSGINIARLERVLNAYNSIHPHRQSTYDQLDLPPSLNLSGDPKERKEVIQAYFLEVLPKLIGLNMGRLHKADLVHVFPHPGNINGLGGLIDLDSVRGVPLRLDDNPITQNDCAADLQYIFDEEYLENVPVLLETIFALDERELSSFIRQFARNLMEGYLKGRDFDPSDPKDLAEIVELYVAISEESIEHVTLDLLLEIISEEFGELIWNEVNCLVSGNIEVSAQEMAETFYNFRISNHEELILECLPPKDQWPITDKELEDAICQNFTYKNGDEFILGNDVYDEVINPYLEDIRYDMLMAEMDNLVTRLEAKIKTHSLDELSRDDVAALVFGLSKDVIKEAAWQTTLPNNETLWPILAKKFRTEYLDRHSATA